MRFSREMIVVAVVDRKISTSDHRMAASITTSKFSPVGRGPHKSICTRLQGEVGITEGHRGTGGGVGISAWQTLHSFTRHSACSSMCGHHTLVRKACFRRTMPRCDSCVISSVRFLRSFGITILVPRTRIPSVDVSSFATFQYTLSRLSSGHLPERIASMTHLISGSSWEACLISSRDRARGIAYATIASTYSSAMS